MYILNTDGSLDKISMNNFIPQTQPISQSTSIISDKDIRQTTNVKESLTLDNSIEIPEIILFHKKKHYYKMHKFYKFLRHIVMFGLIFLIGYLIYTLIIDSSNKNFLTIPDNNSLQISPQNFNQISSIPSISTISSNIPSTIPIPRREIS